MSRLQDLQQRRDIHAARCAELEMALDDLTGLETIADVQRLSDELAAARRLLGALDRQLQQAEQVQRDLDRADRERRRQLATKEAAEIDGEVRRLLLQVYDQVEKREAVTAEFTDLAQTSASMRRWMLDLLRLSGVQIQAGALGAGVSPVRR